MNPGSNEKIRRRRRPGPHRQNELCPGGEEVLRLPRPSRGPIGFLLLDIVDATGQGPAGPQHPRRNRVLGFLRQLSRDDLSDVFVLLPNLKSWNN